MRREHFLLLASVGLNLALALLLVDQTGKQRAAAQLAFEQGNRAEALTRQLRELEVESRTRHAGPTTADSDEVLELARLRNEVTRLRNEARSATSTSPAAPSPKVAPTGSAPQQPAQSGITTFTSTLSANVGLGQALAVGGWASPTSGKRIVGLISPDLHADSPGSILVTMRLIEFPDATMEQLGLHGLRTDGTSSQSQAVFSAEQLKVLLDLTEKTAGIDVMSAPRVVTRSGTQARISVRQAHPDGTQTGPLINLTPTLDATGTAVRLDVGMELNLTSPTKQP